MCANDSQVLTLSDPAFGLAVTVTAISKGYAVSFIDTDAEEIIATKIYPDKMRAIAYARGLVSATATTTMQ
jgi:hypothetical protein